MTQSQDSLRSPLAKARGLGSAKEGTHHWWMQRVTAIALIPLSLWFVCSMGCLMLEGNRMDVVAWFAHPIKAIATAALFLVITLHARLGLQVVIEDYVHCNKAKIMTLLLVKYSYMAAALIAVFAIVKLHFFSV